MKSSILGKLQLAFAVAALAGMGSGLTACVADPAAEDDGSSGDTSGGGKSCPASASGTSGNKIVVRVSWPETIGVEAGSGDLIIWTKAALDFDGGEVTGQVSTCGSVVPALQTKEVVGGMKVQPIIPAEVWDSGLIPKTPAYGAISGTDVGATISMDPAGAAMGVVMADPINDAWPASWSELETEDIDGSGNPGMTALPNLDEGYAAAPLDVFPDGDKAEELYLASRSVIELQGTRDSCTSASGTAIVHAFDNHVVGCKVKGGGACTPSQVDFVDSQRVIYTIESASYKMVQVDPDASCADVRAALPQ